LNGEPDNLGSYNNIEIAIYAKEVAPPDPVPVSGREGRAGQAASKMGFPILSSYEIVLNDLTIQPLNDSTKLPVTENKMSETKNAGR